MECPCLCICVIFVMGVSFSFKIMWGMSGVRVRDYERQNLRYPPMHIEKYCRRKYLIYKWHLCGRATFKNLEVILLEPR